MEWGPICRKLRLSEEERSILEQLGELLEELEFCPEQVAVVALFLRDIRDKQIASVLDMSPDAVNKIHNRAQARMSVRGKGSLMHLLSTGSRA